MQRVTGLHARQLLTVAFVCTFAIALVAGVAAAATIVVPATNPYTVPSNALRGPAKFTIVAHGFPPSSKVYVEQCDGTPGNAPHWSPTANCDLGSSRAAGISDASGTVTFPASDPNHAFPVFRGVSPQSLFNCLSLHDPIVVKPGYKNGRKDPTNGEPDWDNCQMKVSTSNEVLTGDQQFVTLVLPDPPGTKTPTTTKPSKQTTPTSTPGKGGTKGGTNGGSHGAGTGKGHGTATTTSPGGSSHHANGPTTTLNGVAIGRTNGSSGSSSGDSHSTRDGILLALGIAVFLGGATLFVRRLWQTRRRPA
jgi:hypothetical protein